MLDLMNKFVDASTFMSLGYCGLWSVDLLWLHLGADLAVWLAYLTLPCLLLYFTRQSREPRLRWMFWLYCACMVTAGFAHMLDAMAFVSPAHRLMGIGQFAAAVISCSAVIWLLSVIPMALMLKKPNEVQCEIDHRKRAEQALARQARLLDMTHDLIIVRHIDGTIRFFNSGAGRAYGWTQQEALGKKSHLLLRTEFPEPLADINAKLVRDGLWAGELGHSKRDGGRITVASRWILERDDQNEPVSVTELNNDITARKQLEARYQSLLDVAPDAIVLIDDTRTIVLVNSATEKLFGYPRSELEGQALELLAHGSLDSWMLPTDLIHARLDGVWLAAKGQEPRGRRKDGTEFPLELSLSQTESNEGFLTTIAIRDITSRKQAEEDRRRKDDYFRLLIEEVQDYAIFMLDTQGCVASWNSGAERIKGYRAAEIIGKHFSVFHPSANLAESKPEIQLQIAAEQGRHEEEGWRIRKDGSCFWASVILTSLRDATGQLTGFAKIIWDVTGRKRSGEEVEIERQRERVLRLEAANKELEAFSYSVSHDLRAPLRAIDGFSRILLEDYGTAFPQAANDYLQLVRNNAQQMGRLVDALLAFARLNRQAISKQFVDTNRLVRRCLEKLNGDHDGRKLDLTIRDLPPAHAEPTLLEQVWMNLLANAIKYTRYRELTKIEIGVLQADSPDAEPVYFVKDNGVGFDMRYVNKLFGVFQRLHRTEQFEGTGVGLATVKRIVERHGGRVWAESELDKGATFFFSLGPGAEK